MTHSCFTAQTKARDLEEIFGKYAAVKDVQIAGNWFLFTQSRLILEMKTLQQANDHTKL